MVHLSLRPVKLEPSADAVTAVLGVGQRAQERLPDADAPLAERLFALECAARAGAAGAPIIERYRSSLRDVDWWLADDWEPDVPHTVILAQALSANAALDLSTPVAGRTSLRARSNSLRSGAPNLTCGTTPRSWPRFCEGLPPPNSLSPPGF